MVINGRLSRIDLIDLRLRCGWRLNGLSLRKLNNLSRGKRGPCPCLLLRPCPARHRCCRYDSVGVNEAGASLSNTGRSGGGIGASDRRTTMAAIKDEDLGTVGLL